MKAAVVTIAIGELEIEGIDPAGRFEVTRGLSLELTQLLTAHGVPQKLLAGEAGRPPDVCGAGLTAGSLGRAVARAIYEGWR